MFKLYFKQDEIKKVKSRQEQDVFDDILQLKSDAVTSMDDLFKTNRINIFEFLPKIQIPKKKERRDSKSEMTEEDKLSETDGPATTLSSKRPNQQQLIQAKLDALRKMGNKAEAEVVHKKETELLKIEIKDIIEDTLKSSPSNSSHSIKSLDSDKERRQKKSRKRSPKKMPQKDSKQKAGN